LRVKFPEKVAFLSEPHRYKILYGGRGGIKSWTIAQHLPIAGAKRPLRIPCARETMQSIRDSVHQLLEDQITRLGLQAHYELQKAEIIGRRTGTSFTFHGLRDQSVHNIKSLEGADILWVEEAQNVSKKSWRTTRLRGRTP
jgi:phage terminase large subunit